MDGAKPVATPMATTGGNLSRFSTSPSMSNPSEFHSTGLEKRSTEHARRAPVTSTPLSSPSPLCHNRFKYDPCSEHQRRISSRFTAQTWVGSHRGGSGSVAGVPWCVVSFLANGSYSMYLDENKQLILQILDNQSSGKLSECAERLKYSHLKPARLA
ncbi:hypothetical protein MRB53_035494 [Persea americana]|uniref:Uncharacterized protein n=1 Tax=Persea americana TaxID=3435 RepID=A0ACC2K4T9_PERAE|nr:hypothetical protein MRB53_035494 [Persea americana]